MRKLQITIGMILVALAPLTVAIGQDCEVESNFLQPSNPDDCTVGLWHLNEDYGTTVTDVSSNNLNGHLEGESNWDDGQTGFDGAMHCDGTNFLHVPDDDVLTGMSELTLECWFKLDSYGHDFWNYLFEKGGSYTVYIGDADEVNRDKLWAKITTNMGEYSVLSDYLVPLDTWTHIAIIYDGSRLQMYINGELEVETNASGIISNSSTPLYVGSNNLGYQTEVPMHGWIDEVRISNTGRIYSSTLDEDWCLESGISCATSIAAIIPFVGQAPEVVALADGFCNASELFNEERYVSASLREILTVVDLIHFATTFGGNEPTGLTDAIIALANCALGEWEDLFGKCRDDGLSTLECWRDRVWVEDLENESWLDWLFPWSEDNWGKGLYIGYGLCPIDIDIYDSEENSILVPIQNSLAISSGSSHILKGITNENHVLFIIIQPEELFRIEVKGAENARYPDSSFKFYLAKASVDGLEAVEFIDIPVGAGQTYSIIQDPDKQLNKIMIGDIDNDGIRDSIGSYGSIIGNISTNSLDLFGIVVSLYDSNGNKVATTSTDENGHFEFAGINNGEYMIVVAVPLGFTSDEPIRNITVRGLPHEVNFSLSDASSGKKADLWWWKNQFQAINEGVELFNGLTQNDVECYCNAIFEHYHERSDIYRLEIEGVTFTDNPHRPLNFEDICNTYLGPCDESNPAKIRRHLLVLMFNVASGRLNQLKTISADGATLSQAISYFADCYLADDDDWTVWFNMYKIEMGIELPAGIIPLETPNIMYKSGEELNMVNNTRPNEFSLEQNSPNPFNPVTEISFNLPYATDVKLEIFNIMGQRITILTDKGLEAGKHKVNWDGSGTASGIYFYKLRAGDFSATRKMVLLK